MQYVHHYTPNYILRKYSKKKQRLVSKRMHNGGHLCHLGCSQQMPIDWFRAHITLGPTVEEADELPVVVMAQKMTYL